MTQKFPPDLLQYCTTKRQVEHYTAMMEAGTYRGAAKLLGIRAHQTLQTLFYALKARKERGGVYNPATRSTAPLSLPEAPPSKAINTRKRRRKYVITCAQNATPAFDAGLASLRTYCREEGAELIVIPIRYHNATSVWTKTDEDQNWWAPSLAADLVDSRVELCANLVLLADVRIQPTAVRPTSGIETFCGGQSIIIGHPKLEVATIPTPQHHLAKIIHTTGAITVDNYTDSKAGKKGEHHHAFGAVVVEIEGDRFHLRQINMDDDGSFYDLDAMYSGDTVERGIPIEALVLGDLHERFVDPGVVRATFGAGGMTETLRPKAVVFHDVMDFHSQNHHHARKVFTKIAKHRGDRSSVEDEVNECAAFIDRHAQDGQRVVFVPSNHPDALARWVEDSDWKEDPENAEFYLKTALAMAESARMSDSGASYLDPFVYWMRQKLGSAAQCEFPARDESVMIAGIECGMHGDKGPNGARGAIRGFGRIGVRSIIGHSHTPGVMDGVYQVGTSSRLRMEYNAGPSSWMHCHCAVYRNGKRSLLWVVDGHWRQTETKTRRKG